MGESLPPLVSGVGERGIAGSFFRASCSGSARQLCLDELGAEPISRFVASLSLSLLLFIYLSPHLARRQRRARLFGARMVMVEGM